MATSTEDPDLPSQSRFSSNNPFRSRRRTSTVSSLKPPAEAPLPQPRQQPLQHHDHLQQLSPPQGQPEKRSGKRTHHLHGHNLFSRRRQSAWDAASIASSASSPSAAEMDRAEHQTKRPSRRMTLTTTRPFVHAENVPLPSLPAHFRSKNLSSYDAPSSASFASLAYDSISPPSTAPGSTAASTSHRRPTTSSRPTTTSEGGFSARRPRNTRDAPAAPPNDAPLIFPISFDDFHNSISVDGGQTIASDTLTNDNTFNIPSGTELDSPELASVFPNPAAYEPTSAAAHDSSAMDATGTTAGNSPSSNHHNKSSFSKNSNSSSNHAITTTPSSSNTRKGSIAKTTTNLRTGRNPNVAALSGSTRHDSNASTSTTTSTSRTTNSNNANHSSLPHQQSHLRLQTSASNLAGSSASPVPSRFTRQGRGTATGTTTGGASSSHTRPPRKSIGPGVLPSSHSSSYDIGNGDGTSKYPIKRRPSLVKRKSGDVARVLRGIEHDRSNGGGIGARNDDMPDFLSRNPFIHAMNENIDPSNTTHTTASSSNNQPIDEPLRSPGGNGKHTPTAKRMSMVPPHHTGLGARTISPTDVRKIKRMSTVSEGSSGGNGNNSAGGAAAPPTPHLDEFPSHLLSHAVISPNVSASGYSD
ncbi:putative PHD type zinc finger protein with BAH domain-containing protein, partial [Ascosphaera pollenicola]